MIVFAMLHNDNSDQASSKQTSTRSHNSPFQTTTDSFRQQLIPLNNTRLLQTTSSSPPTNSLSPSPNTSLCLEQQFGSDRRRRPRLSHTKRSAFSDGRRFYSERLLQLIPIPSSKSRDSFIDRQPFGDHSAAVHRLLGNFSANLRRLLGEFSANSRQLSANSRRLLSNSSDRCDSLIRTVTRVFLKGCGKDRYCLRQT